MSEQGFFDCARVIWELSGGAVELAQVCNLCGGGPCRIEIEMEHGIMIVEDKPSELDSLGKQVDVAANPKAAKLETVPAPAQDQNYLVRLTCPEFTSLCPVTGQPDFAHLVIDYAPSDKLVESKSFKLFLQSFRNHGAFHERVTMYIASRLQETLETRWLRIYAFWYPRGGIPIDCFWQSGDPPDGLYVHPVDVPGYRGR